MSEQGLKIDPSSGYLPILTLRDVVVFPNMVIPLFVGREHSIKALDLAMSRGKKVLLIAQKSADIDEPTEDQLNSIGTLAKIVQLLKLPDGTIKVLVEGIQRIGVEKFGYEDGCLIAESMLLYEETVALEQAEQEVLTRSLLESFEQCAKINKKISEDVLSSLAAIDGLPRMADTIASHLTLKQEQRQSVLEIIDPVERVEHLMGLMEGELDLFRVEKRIRGRVKKQMEKSQREYYLNEQIKAIQKELGDMEDVPNELEELEEKILKGGLSREAREKGLAELKKLRMMSAMSAEATVVRNYVDTLVKLPWNKRSKIHSDIAQAEQVLEEDHFGLEKVKERILEYLAVQQRVKKLKGPILCLVGPPGVGKTSLGRSIARATKRKFVRMSLGGVRDEAEIRGHRRTYIGSMPGKIVQSLIKIEKKNPLLLLDEIDKLSTDFRGDPASALLEVLDPEQNNTFADHYLEVDFDLSGIMFVCTANSLNIPSALLDRMEVIQIPGYTENEKLGIAVRYLIPRKMEENGLRPGELEITEEAVREIIRRYTREAGVRNLEREISKICRKAVKNLLLDKEVKSLRAEPDNLESYLGVYRYRYGKAEEQDQVGQVTGLAWTEVGGELLTIEAAVVEGKGKLAHTGKLGDVMKESIQAAMTVVRTRALGLGLSPGFHEEKDLHIHVPEGATPKDGPSAGIAMCTAIVSALTGVKVRSDVAMTGEITLRGEVLPIGGLKEKLLAAQRGGISTVLIPDENRKDLSEIPEGVISKIDVIPVRWIDDVFKHALCELPTPPEDLTSGGAGASYVSDDGSIRHH